MIAREIFYYVVCCIVIIGTLVGITMMSKVKTAVSGNKVGVISILIAIVLTMWYNDMLAFILLTAIFIEGVYSEILLFRPNV